MHDPAARLELLRDRFKAGADSPSSLFINDNYDYLHTLAASSLARHRVVVSSRGQTRRSDCSLTACPHTLAAFSILARHRFAASSRSLTLSKYSGNEWQDQGGGCGKCAWIHWHTTSKQ